MSDYGTMTFDEIVQSRYSVRSFEDRDVADDDVRAICEAARLAPSACNSQTWRYVAVTDRKCIHRICDDALRPIINNSWLRQAPVLIVGCSRLDLLANGIGRRVTGIEYFQIDLGIAMEHMVLKATELGLGTCWVGWFKEKRIKEILRIPRRVKVSALLAVGYSAKETPGEHSRKPLNEILYWGSWGKQEKDEAD